MSDSWVPIDKEIRSLLSKLSKKGSFSEVEAMISLQLDFDEKKPVSVAGYANLWGWSRDKVRRFLDDRGAEIIYPEDTKSKQNQRGYIKKTDRKTDVLQIKKQIGLIDINELRERSNRSKNRNPTDRQVTTIYPNTNTNPNTKEKTLVEDKSPTTKGGNKGKEFSEDSVEYQLADYLFQRILKVNPENKKPNLQKWAGDIDLMLRIDGRKPERVRNVIDWIFDGKSKEAIFWQSGIKSGEKLRKQYDQLSIQMKNGGHKKADTCYHDEGRVVSLTHEEQKIWKKETDLRFEYESEIRQKAEDRINSLKLSGRYEEEIKIFKPKFFKEHPETKNNFRDEATIKSTIEAGFLVEIEKELGLGQPESFERWKKGEV